MAALRLLDPTVQQRFIIAIQHGSSHAMACRYADISDETWRRYRIAAASRKERGVTGDQDPIVAFVDAVMRAEADNAMRYLHIIEQAAIGERDAEGQLVRAPDWRAAAWKLERRWPQEFGKQAMEITGPNGGPVTLAMPPLPRETRDDLLE